MVKSVFRGSTLFQKKYVIFIHCLRKKCRFCGPYKEYIKQEEARTKKEREEKEMRMELDDSIFYNSHKFSVFSLHFVGEFRKSRFIIIIDAY